MTLSFCVVTPSYNQGAFIERTIRSVLEQDVDGLDYVVVDGGSNDETLDVLRRFEGRLRWVSEADEGQAHAVDKGFDMTSAEIIGWLNSDDVYAPGALAAVRDAFAERPDADVIYGDAEHIDESGRVIEPYPTEPWDPERLLDVCFLCQPAVFFRRRVVERWGPLDVRLNYCLDYEYWIRLAHGSTRFQGRARFHYLRRVLAGSRLYASNKTLGQRIPVHAEINLMMRRRLGRVPERWISNYVHAVLGERGFRREDGPWRFAVVVALSAWLAALRWNHGVSRGLWRTTWEWMRAARRESSPRAPTPRRRSGRRRRIGFDVSQTGSGKAGCGYEADSLIQALAEVDGDNEYVLYPTFGGNYWDPEGPDATRRIDGPRFDVAPAQATHAEARRFWESPPADFEARLGRPDVVHSHNFFCPTGLTSARLVYTVHDLAFLVHPEWTTELNRRVCFEGVFHASLNADLVLADSESTRRHFLQTFPHYPEERTAVAYLASRFTDTAPVKRPPSLSGLEPGAFFLSVATLEPRKNQERLLRAYAEYASDGGPLPLVLAGGRGWLMEDFERRIEALGLGDSVRLLGYVDDAALVWLYRNAFAFLYPSLFEGFGLPVVEAMSQGAAVMTSRVTSLPEVVGDAALLVDPCDEAEIAAAIRRLAVDEPLRRELREKAPVQAGRFSWRETARQVLGHYRRVVTWPKYAE